MDGIRAMTGAEVEAQKLRDEARKAKQELQDAEVDHRLRNGVGEAMMAGRATLYERITKDMAYLGEKHGKLQRIAQLMAEHPEFEAFLELQQLMREAHIDGLY